MKIDSPINQCPACLSEVLVAAREDWGDVTCVNCGQQLFFLRLGRGAAAFFCYPRAAEIRRRVVHFLATQLGVPDDAISDNTALFSNAGLDSLQLVQLVMELEEADEL